jgi:hypothetical protein
MNEAQTVPGVCARCGKHSAACSPTPLTRDRPETRLICPDCRSEFLDAMDEAGELRRRRLAEMEGEQPS